MLLFYLFCQYTIVISSLVEQLYATEKGGDLWEMPQLR